MAAQRDDAAAGPAHVPEQLLDDRGGADVLHADRVLRPADRVAERARPLAAGVLRERLGDREEVLDGAAARLGDELGRVALVVPLQELEDAARMLSVGILGRRLAVASAAAVPAVPDCVPFGSSRSRLPAAPCVSIPSYCQRRVSYFACLGIPAGEEAVEVLGVRERPRR